MRVLVLLLILSAAAWAEVSPVIEVTGSQGGAGLLSARDAVRRWRAAGETRVITVRFGDGIYPLPEPVSFEPQDGHVTYEAAPGAKPIFVGGRRLAGWQPGPGGIWTTRVPEAAAGGKPFEFLWVNGERAVRARTPNEGFWQAMNQPTEPLPGIPFNDDAGHTLLQLRPEDAAVLKGLTPEELREANLLAYHSWDVNRLRIAGVRATDGVLQFTGGGAHPFFKPEPYQRVHLENFRAALDAPGEWFLARDGVLSYLPRPGEKMETAEVWAPTSEGWLRFSGKPEEKALVEGLTFRGLAFRFQGYTLPEKGASLGQAESTLGAAIEADGAREIVFDHCEFGHTATNVAWFRRGCHEVAMRSCWLHDLGAGGVKIGDPAVSNDGPQQTSGVTIEDCIIHSGGRYFMGAIGVTIFHASHCVLRHCDIADFFYSAVSIGWTWGYKPTAAGHNRVEFCHLHHLGWSVLSDMAAVYTLGAQPGTVIRNCHIHDIGVASYGGWGMYNDEGSTGVVWENNLVHHLQDAGYHQHYGRGNIVRNNIIAFCAEEHVRRSRPEEFFAFTFERNIVLLGEGKLFAHVNKNWRDGRVDLHDNLYWKPGGTLTDFAGMPWGEWQALGQDTGSLVADPLFRQPDQGDWSLAPDSPAMTVGFVPFDWREAGVRGDEEWRRLAAREFPPMRYGMKPKPAPLSIREGFEKTAPGAVPTGLRASPKAHLAVVEGPANEGKRSLEMTDSPETQPAWEPHFYYQPHYETGTVRLSFSARLEPGYQLLVEWRDDGEPYHTGPALAFREGAVWAGARKLLEVKANTWVKVEMEARLGNGAAPTWSCGLTPLGGDTQRFEGLPFVSALMKKVAWVGFISPGKVAAKGWVDDLTLGCGE